MARAVVELGDVLWIGGMEIELVDRVGHLARVCPQTVAPSDQRTIRQWMTPERTAGRQLGAKLIELLLWFSRGLTDAVHLGRKLNRSPLTIETQFRSIFRTLDVHSKNQLQHWLKHSTRTPGGYW